MEKREKKIMSANETTLIQKGLAGKRKTSLAHVDHRGLDGWKEKGARPGCNSSHTSFCTSGCWFSAWGAIKFRELLVFFFGRKNRWLSQRWLVVGGGCIQHCKASIFLFLSLLRRCLRPTDLLGASNAVRSQPCSSRVDADNDNSLNHVHTMPTQCYPHFCTLSYSPPARSENP
jgi:hypothetical protein